MIGLFGDYFGLRKCCLNYWFYFECCLYLYSSESLWVLMYKYQIGIERKFQGDKL